MVWPTLCFAVDRKRPDAAVFGGTQMRYLGALAVGLVLWTGPVMAECKVALVLDGNTLTLLCGAQMHRVRLLGYDTPEITRPRCAAEQAAGQLAADRLRHLVAAGAVTQVRFGLDAAAASRARVRAEELVADCTGLMIS